MFIRSALNSLRFCSLKPRKKMNSCFVQTLNPINNKMEWKIVNDDYDYNQEIVTSCYGDMLHDEERNKKFGEALKKGIEKFHSEGKEAHVLDIGTGTGLLSMLAVRYGADSVVACEAFLPMANCAVEIISENGFSEKIKVIRSHSTSLKIGEKEVLKQKANILVSEVFDTELIGEGALGTFNHALQNLLQDDCIVIPSGATIYAQVIESDLAQKWNKLVDVTFHNNYLLKIPKQIKECPGNGAVHDIQLSEFSHEHFRPLSDVVPIFRFEWGEKKLTPTFKQVKSEIKAKASGKAQVVFMWWDLIMDQEGDILLSCAPVWKHPDAKGSSLNIKSLTKILPWRDHWMQAVYFLPKEVALLEDKTFTLSSTHDEFSFWFQIEDKLNLNLQNVRPECNCAFHFIQSRTRIGALNDCRRQSYFFKLCSRFVTSETVCLILGDITLLGLIAAKLGAKKVYVTSENSSVNKVWNTLSAENKLAEVLSSHENISSIMKSIEEDFSNNFFDVLILSEPYFRNSILPWDNLAFWFMKEEVKHHFAKLKQIRSVRIVPNKGVLKGCAVKFDNLWKIATPLNNCEGFSLQVFDKLIEKAKNKAGVKIETQPLWEYPCIALSHPFELFEFDFTQSIPKEHIKKKGSLQIQSGERCDGIALWMEYYSTTDCSISCGPTEEVIIGKYILWDMFERQGVHLFAKQPIVNAGDLILYEIDFDPYEAELNFIFSFSKE